MTKKILLCLVVLIGISLLGAAILHAENPPTGFAQLVSTQSASPTCKKLLGC